jgi:hypothetical protein
VYRIKELEKGQGPTEGCGAIKTEMQMNEWMDGRTDGRTDGWMDRLIDGCREVTELHNLYSSPSINRMSKTRMTRLAGHVARIGRRGMHIGYWWDSQKESDHCEDQDVGGWTILKLILEK